MSSLSGTETWHAVSQMQY